MKDFMFKLCFTLISSLAYVYSYIVTLSGSPEKMSVWLGGNRLGEDEEAWVWSTGENVTGDLWGVTGGQGLLIFIVEPMLLQRVKD